MFHPGLGRVFTLLPHPLHRQVAALAASAAVPNVPAGLEVQQQVEKVRLSCCVTAFSFLMKTQCILIGSRDYQMCNKTL